MKIGSLDNKQPVTTVTPAATERKANGAAAPANPASSASVAISAEASALTSATGDGSFDAAKVDRISQAIKDGSFKPNPDAIADKLIANAQELLARTYR